MPVDPYEMFRTAPLKTNISMRAETSSVSSFVLSLPNELGVPPSNPLWSPKMASECRALGRRTGGVDSRGAWPEDIRRVRQAGEVVSAKSQSADRRLSVWGLLVLLNSCYFSVAPARVDTNNQDKSLIRVKMLHANTSAGTFWFDPTHPERNTPLLKYCYNMTSVHFEI